MVTFMCGKKEPIGPVGAVARGFGAQGKIASKEVAELKKVLMVAAVA